VFSVTNKRAIPTLAHHPVKLSAVAAAAAVLAAHGIMITIGSFALVPLRLRAQLFCA